MKWKDDDIKEATLVPECSHGLHFQNCTIKLSTLQERLFDGGVPSVAYAKSKLFHQRNFNEFYREPAYVVNKGKGHIWFRMPEEWM